jgi:hypothetical protein
MFCIGLEIENVFFERDVIGVRPVFIGREAIVREGGELARAYELCVFVRAVAERATDLRFCLEEDRLQRTVGSRRLEQSLERDLLGEFRRRKKGKLSASLSERAAIDPDADQMERNARGLK